jgi:hypothetical protein
MDAACEDAAVANESVSVWRSGCVGGKPDRPSSALHLNLFDNPTLRELGRILSTRAQFRRLTRAACVGKQQISC